MAPVGVLPDHPVIVIYHGKSIGWDASPPFKSRYFEIIAALPLAKRKSSNNFKEYLRI